MDEYDLKKLLTLPLFEAGRSLIESDCLDGPFNFRNGIKAYEVTDNGSVHTVLVRTYSNGRDPFYDCDCSKTLCNHIAAVTIREEFDDLPEEYYMNTDDSVIQDLESRIDSLEHDIRSDPGYDEDENYWDDWEIRKYNLEPANDEVEREYVEGILKDIFDNVYEPPNALTLLDRLFHSIRSMEFDAGGTDDAILDYEGQIVATVSYADAETVASIMTSNGSSWCEPWIVKYLGDRKTELEAEAYRMNLEKGDSSPTMRSMMLENGDYDKLVACRDGNASDIISVVNKLLGQGSRERARDYAIMLRGKTVDNNCREVADALYSVGLVDDAAPMFLKLYRESGSLDYLERAFDSEMVKRDSHIDDVVSANEGLKTYRSGQMTFLIRHGRVDEVERILRNVDYTSERWMGSPDFSGNMTLFEALIGKGRYHSAAMVARHIIDGVLAVNDNKNYGRIIEFIRVMDGDKGFENAVPPHSEYMAHLSATTNKKTKFWGMYNGTYVEKSRNRYRYF